MSQIRPEVYKKHKSWIKYEAARNATESAEWIREILSEGTWDLQVVNDTKMGQPIFAVKVGGEVAPLPSIDEMDGGFSYRTHKMVPLLKLREDLDRLESEFRYNSVLENEDDRKVFILNNLKL